MEFKELAPTEAPRPEKIEVAPMRTETEQKIVEQKTFSTEHVADTVRHTFMRPKKTPSLPPPRDELSRRVEKIMEEHLNEAYGALDPVEQQEFKLAGERTAYAISQLLKKTHVKVKKIFSLIFAWLKMLPGVNRYFLEQEAKIKADKILAIKYRTDGT